MWRTILSWFAVFLLVVISLVPRASAQDRKDLRMTYSNEPTSETKEHGPPALPYALAVLAAILILVILCMPSRKRSLS